MPRQPSAGPFIIQSHGGAGDLAPDNTLEAFEVGWRLGTWPEADLRTTGDGIIVPFHDHNFRRILRDADPVLAAKGVADLTWAELGALDVGAWKGEEFAGRRICRITEVFGRMADRPDRHLYLDIKQVDLAQLAGEVRAHGVQNRVVLASTDYDLIRRWKALMPDSGTLLWMGGEEPVMVERIGRLRQRGFADVTQLQIHVHVKPDADLSRDNPFTPSDRFLIDLGRELLERDILFQTLPWRTNDLGVYGRLMEMGVRSFATDHPEATLEAVRQYHPGPLCDPT